MVPVQPAPPHRSSTRRHVMSTVEPTASATNAGSAALLWIGTDDRGVELEIVAAVLPDLYLVIHVMPTALRR